MGFRVYGLGSVSFKRVPLRDGFEDFGFRVQDLRIRSSEIPELRKPFGIDRMS